MKYEVGSQLEGRWVLARDLLAGDVVFFRQLGEATVEFVELADVTETVYNFHVAELQNYAVGERGVLVHNTNDINAGDLRALSKARIKQLAFDAEAFKADMVGAKGGAKFNIAVGPNGEIYLVPVRAGATPPVPTGHTLSELPHMYPLGGRLIEMCNMLKI